MYTSFSSGSLYLLQWSYSARAVEARELIFFLLFFLLHGRSKGHGIPAF